MVAAVTYMSGSSSQRIALDAQPVAAYKQTSMSQASSADAHSKIPSTSTTTKTSQPQAPEPSTNPTVPPTDDGAPVSEGGEPSEDEESSGGAFNPATGEINWDCPCLGGMAHGPCGPQFREAFSCFVFSEKEPKGIDCVEKFKGMQDCFREHPDVYGEEIMDDDEDDESEALDASSSPVGSELPEGVPSTTTTTTQTIEGGLPPTQPS